jgi:UDP-glucose 4-epimerase
MKTVLVTGSSGRSGHAIASLLSEKFEVRGIDIRPGEFTTHIASITDWQQVQKVSKGVDAIMHTASLHAPHVATHSKEEFIDTNVKGTLYLLEAARLHGVRKFIYTSTTSVYGESLVDPEKAVWVTEDLPARPRDIYDITKLTAEALCKDFFDKESLQSINLRVSRFWNEPLPDKLFYRMYRGVDVRDVAKAHHLALTIDFDTFQLFNISAQSVFGQHHLYALKQDLHALLKKEIPQMIEIYAKRNWKLPESIDRVYSIEKARKMLNYRPGYNFSALSQKI